MDFIYTDPASIKPFDGDSAMRGYINGMKFTDLLQQQKQQQDQTQQQSILVRLISQNTGLDGQVDLNKALQSVQTNPNQSYQPEMVNTLSGLLQQRDALRAKAQQDAEKQKIDNAKVIAETRDKELGTTQKGQTLLSNLIATSTDVGDAMRKLEVLGSQYGLPPELIQSTLTDLKGLAANNKGGSDAFESLRKSYGLLGAEKPIEYMQPNANTVANNDTSIETTRMTTDATKRGQDIIAETANKDRDQKATQFQKSFEYQAQQDEIKNGQGEIKEFGGKTYIVYKNGTYRPMVGEDGLPLGSANAKGMTEQQSKDALFGARMQQSNNILLALEKDNVSAPVMSHAGSYGESYAQVMPSLLGGASSKQQQYMQAQRDFINAVLRKESGAAIAESEFDNARKQYFPQVGDSATVKAQKAQNRKLALDMIINASGPLGQKNIQRVTQPKQTVPYANAGQNQNRQSLDNIF